MDIDVKMKPDFKLTSYIVNVFDCGFANCNCFIQFIFFAYIKLIVSKIIDKVAKTRQAGLHGCATLISYMLLLVGC